MYTLRQGGSKVMGDVYISFAWILVESLQDTSVPRISSTYFQTLLLILSPLTEHDLLLAYQISLSYLCLSVTYIELVVLSLAGCLQKFFIYLETKSSLISSFQLLPLLPLYTVTFERQESFFFLLNMFSLWFIYFQFSLIKPF